MLRAITAPGAEGSSSTGAAPVLLAAKLANANRYKAGASELPTTFPPTVEVYHELSLKRIIVEIQAHDKIGLLYQLVRTISDHGFDITFARINTERSIALDTFYVEPQKKDTVVEEAQLGGLIHWTTRELAVANETM